MPLRAGFRPRHSRHSHRRGEPGAVSRRAAARPGAQGGAARRVVKPERMPSSLVAGGGAQS
jgi:hypothetical protein